MAPRRLLSKIGQISHLPTWALLIGYVVFWLELYVVRLPQGRCSWLSWVLWAGVGLVCILNQRGEWARRMIFFKEWILVQNWIYRFLFFAGFILAAAYLGIALYAALLPPHLVQEYDSLNYHLMLPRQHLLRHSFAHIPWSVPDLFLLPLDYALAPFCLATQWPNKWMFFIFLLGILACAYQITMAMSAGSKKHAWAAVLAVMATHMIAIQAGTAMLDVVMLYCFLACVDSLWRGRWVWAAIEGAFFVWSKSFIPLQMGLAGAALLLFVFFLSKRHFTIHELPVLNGRQWKIWGGTFFFSSLLIGLPHVFKSFYYTGTPLYPFAIGHASPMVNHPLSYWQDILHQANALMALKDAYGHGHSWIAFLKHFWLIAVPEKGVNNAFDYPVGLIYLLAIVPFCVHLARSFKSKKIPLLSLWVILFWLSWWFGSQQTRFLLVPIVVMIVTAIAYMPTIGRIFLSLVVVTLGLEVVSLTNAHRHDWGKPAAQMIRAKDQELLALAKENPKEPVFLDYPDVAFASFAVNAYDPTNSVFVFNSIRK